MKFTIMLAIFIIAAGNTLVAGQTAKDLDALYGRRDNVYSVSEHLWMTPNYDADGQLCLMRVYPKLVSADANYLDAKLETDETLEFIQIGPGRSSWRAKGFFWNVFNWRRRHLDGFQLRPDRVCIYLDIPAGQR